MRRDQKPIAIIEAKRDARDPLKGKRQAEELAFTQRSGSSALPVLEKLSWETRL